jgi:hypothetical protein
MERAMDEDLDDLLESGGRLRVSAAWLREPIEGYVEHCLWWGDPNVFFFQTDDGEVYVLQRTDPSLRVELVAAP